MKIKTSTGHDHDYSDVAPAVHATPHRPSINITPVERMARILLGVAAVVFGIVLLTTAGSVIAVVLELLFVAAGVDLIVTGALGHCPLYQRLGRVSPSLRGRS